MKNIINIVILIITILIISYPVESMSESYNVINESSNKNIENENNINNSVNSENLDYEREASSWRFSNGYLIDHEDTNAKFRASFVPWSKVNGQFISSDGSIIEGAINKGIDVSKYQGKIDWNQVKSSDVDFVIIRCGYGSNYTYQDDDYWEYNVSECERLGIPYGVYLYSYANNATKARSEAQHVLRLLEGHKPSYPVYYDLEDDIVSASGKNNIINFANIFCSTIESYGYKAGIYANLNWWNNKLNDDSLEKYEKWVAQWNSKCTYDGDFRLWQCTSNGMVPGINGRVDINFEFFMSDTIIDVEDYNIIINDNRNVRTGPGMSYPIKDFLEKGEIVTITHKAGTWGKLEDSDNWIELSAANEI